MKNDTSTLSFFNLDWVSYHHAHTSSIAQMILSRTSPTSTLLLLASLFFLHHFRSDRHKKNDIAPLPPGPSPWPLVGNIPELMANKPAFRWILALMKEMNTSIACIRLGNTHIIPVTCPEIAREFLKRHDAIFASRPLTMGTEYSSRGFLSVATAPQGEQWKKMRRVVASEVLSPARLRWLLDKRTEEADNLLRYLYNQCRRSHFEESGAVVNVRKAVRQYSSNVIRKLMFNQRNLGNGQEDGGPGVEEEEHVEALFTVLSLLYAFSVSDYIPKLRWMDLDGHEKIMKKAIRVVTKYQEPIIDERIEKWRTGRNVFIKKAPEDLLDVLIMAKDTDGKPLLTPEEIKAQAADLIYASVDNPSNAVEWALAEMPNQPKVLQKAVEEVDRVVGKERLVQESDFSELNYIKACAREAFRLHPIAPFNLPHVATADATVGGYFIPKGSHVLLSRIGLGRNPKVWDDPLRFNPDRHLKDTATDVELTENDLRFISFSTGRRGCMGAPLGSAMTVMLLARLLQGFTWSVPPGESRIELTESVNDLFLAEALHAYAKPRLPAHMYPTN
ncbi:hypothetical protein MRB53_033105 [Persea americana]|uniref:Uncharacterized protein n=1 Tax=Persea americana TaxID=3435 RepID=A0ACC2KUA0_PERAE|nr:hypothetical protein MRB53_033105 [Persea americana]